MVKKEIYGKVFYKCSECGLYYNEKIRAKKCEDYCLKHKSCNIEITKHSINPIKTKN